MANVPHTTHMYGDIPKDRLAVAHNNALYVVENQMPDDPKLKQLNIQLRHQHGAREWIERIVNKQGQLVAGALCRENDQGRSVTIRPASITVQPKGNF